MEKLRTILGSFWFIHLMVFLGLFSLFGFLILNNKYLIFCAVLSYSGAVCGSFINVIDTAKEQK